MPTALMTGTKGLTSMETVEIDRQDEELIEAATEVLRKNYTDGRHTVGAAVRCGSRQIYTGVNIESCGYGPCAEPIALGAAISAGEREFVAIVAVGARPEGYAILSPCGNCRQMLLDYAPEALVILETNDKRVKARVLELLPAAYGNFD